MYERVEPEFRHCDARGSLVQLTSGGVMQVNVLKTRSGVVRGGHYHKRSTEAFYVVSGVVEASFACNGKKEKRLFRPGDFFAVPPNTVHTMRFLEDCVLVALYDRAVDGPEGRDIYQEGSLRE